MNISDDLVYNIFSDWKKRSISPLEKSEFIKQVLEKQGISQRQLARRMGISHSTMQDWVSMRQVGKEKKGIDGVNCSTIYSLADRLIYLLSKKDVVSDKESRKLDLLINEIRNKKVLDLDEL